MTNTGLVSSHIPTPQNLTVAKTAAIQASPHAFNASQPALKLGLPPLGEKLKEEVKKILRTDRVAAPMDIDIDEKDETALGADGKPLAVPKDDDLLPMPINFRTFDVHREVSRIVDSRKRLRLGPTAGPSATTPEAKWEPGVEGRVVLPSICAYTFDDNGEGITCSEFSKDASLMAAGSEESCVRLWSLKGEKLRGIRSDFEASNVRDGASASSTLSDPHPWADPVITHSCSVVAKEDAGKVGDIDAQADRPLGTRLRPLVLALGRLGRAAAPSAVGLGRRHRPPVVDGHVLGPRRLQGSPGPRLGRRMGARWRLLCQRRPRPDGPALGRRADERAADVCRPPRRRRRQSLACSSKQIDLGG
jgi:hypothetical protein